MADKTVKVRMLVPRGDPRSGGAIIARGAIVEIPEAWATRFIADGTAVEEAKKTKAEPKVEDHPKPAAKGKKK